MKNTISIAAVLLSLTMPAVAQAIPDHRTISAAAPETLAAAMQDLGYRAQLGIDNVGDPVITSVAEGTTYDIQFYGCAYNVDCQDLMFAIRYGVPTPLSVEAMNSWNQQMLFGRAYVGVDGDVYFEMPLPGATSMSPASFELVLERWGEAVAEFENFIDW